MAIDYYYPVIGGSEIQAYRLSEMLLKMGQKVFIVTRKTKDTGTDTTKDHENVYKLSVFGKKRIASILFLIKTFFFLLRYMLEYDVIHCHLATSTALGCLMAGWFVNAPVLIKLGGSGKTGDIQTSTATRGGNLKLGLLKRGRCRFVVPSKEIAQEMINAGFNSKKIMIIPNGVDSDYFCPITPIEKNMRKRGVGIEGMKLALYIGRLEYGKGIILMIDAWARLNRMTGNWRLLIIGSGRLENAIKHKIKEKGMEKRISLIPPISPDKVRDYLQIGDLFIQPSRYEGLSNSILEAMSCELPVIASRIGGNQELINDRINGLLFNPGDISDLSRVLAKALEDDKERKILGINARKWVTENLDLKLITKMYIQLYQKMLS